MSKILMSLSLAVSDIETSVAFYEALGFNVIDGGHLSSEYPDTDKAKWRIVALGYSRIGLFAGMFEHNMMTFYNMDMAEVGKKLNEIGVKRDSTSMVEDPDGNIIHFE